MKDHAGGREIHRDEVKTNPVRGSIFALDVGVFGSTEELQRVAQAAMDDAIDTAISKPGFAAALVAR